MPVDQNDHYVYGYFEPESAAPFYIGKGRGRRAKSHLTKCNTPFRHVFFYHYLRTLIRAGIEPEVRILQEGMANSEAKDKEVELIRHWGRIDLGTGCLTNQTDGGDGAVSLSPEVREKMSQMLRERWSAPLYREKVSESLRERYQDPKLRRQMSQQSRELWGDPEHRERIRKIICDIQQQPEARARQSQHTDEMWLPGGALWTAWQNPELREWMGQHVRDRWADPEYREMMRRRAAELHDDPARYAKKTGKISEKAKKRWADPTFRERMSVHPKKASKPIEAFDLNTGSVVTGFASARDAVSAGFNAKNIGQVCRGEKKTHKGLGWRYTTREG